MSSIRVDINFTIFDGAQVSFKSPANFADVTGLRVYYPETATVTNSQDFIFADAHGVDVTDLDDLFGESAMVKVLLDTVHNRAFVQNADTNSYLENRFKAIEETPASQDKLGMMSAADKTKLDGIPGDAQQQINDKVPVGEKTIDSNVASMKVVPEGSGKYAAVNKLGGMSYKSRNLYENRATSFAGKGITWTVNEDGTVIANGTATELCQLSLGTMKLPKGKYKATGFDGSVGGVQFHIKANTDTGWPLVVGEKDLTYTEDVNVYFIISVGAGVTVNNLKFYPMIRRAEETNSTYEPYYSGIRNAAVYEIKSGASKNLLSIYRNTRTNGGVLFTRNQDNSFSLSGTCTNNVVENIGKVYLVKGTQYKVTGCPAGGARDTHLLRVIYPDGSMFVEDKGSGLLFTPSQTGYFTVGIRVQAGINTNGLTFYPMIRLAAETDETYTPYKESVLEIPEAIGELEGYGIGINENYYNYINFERKVYVPSCKEIDLSALSWTTDGKRFMSGNIADALPAGSLICDKYNFLDVNDFVSYTQDKTITMSDNRVISVYDTSYTDIASFKEAIKGVSVIYELETPEEIDISEYLPDDNFIEVAPGGIITAVNEYNYDAPTEIEFYVGDSNKDIVVADTFVGNLIGTANNAKVAENLSNLIEDLENPGCYYRIVNGVQEWINPPMIKDTEYQTTERWLGKPVYTKVVSKYQMATYIQPNTKTNITISTETQDFEILVRYSGLARPASSSSASSKRIMPIPGFTFDEEGTIGEGTGSIGIRYMSSSEIVLACNGPAFSTGTNFFVQVWYTKSEVSTTEVEEETGTTETE